MYEATLDIGIGYPDHHQPASMFINVCEEHDLTFQAFLNGHLRRSTIFIRMENDAFIMEYDEPSPILEATNSLTLKKSVIRSIVDGEENRINLHLRERREKTVKRRKKGKREGEMN